MAGFSMGWSGVAQFEGTLDRLKAQGEMAMGRAIYAEAWRIMRTSQTLVPFERGTLSASGDVSDPVSDGRGGVEVRLGYGGAAEAYALVQHERLDFRHAAGRQAKYLEQPMLEAAAGMEHRLAGDFRLESGPP